MTDTVEFEIALKRAGLTKKKVAQSLGISEMGLYQKVNNITEFKASEISKLYELLNLSNLAEQQRIFLPLELIVNQQHVTEGGITMSKHKLPPPRFGARTLAEVVREVRTIAEAMSSFNLKQRDSVSCAVPLFLLSAFVYRLPTKYHDSSSILLFCLFVK